jgi:hypothetical protein
MCDGDKVEPVRGFDRLSQRQLAFTERGSKGAG